MCLKCASLVLNGRLNTRLGRLIGAVCVVLDYCEKAVQAFPSAVQYASGFYAGVASFSSK